MMYIDRRIWGLRRSRTQFYFYLTLFFIYIWNIDIRPFWTYYQPHLNLIVCIQLVNNFFLMKFDLWNELEEFFFYLEQFRMICFFNKQAHFDPWIKERHAIMNLNCKNNEFYDYLITWFRLGLNYRPLICYNLDKQCFRSTLSMMTG